MVGTSCTVSNSLNLVHYGKVCDKNVTNITIVILGGRDFDGATTVFTTLGISDHIRNYETHMWVARVIQHAAVILVFIEGTNVTFGQQKSLSGGLGWW